MKNQNVLGIIFYVFSDQNTVPDNESEEARRRRRLRGWNNNSNSSTTTRTPISTCTGNVDQQQQHS